MKQCDLQRCTTYLTLLTTLLFSGCTSVGMSSDELEKLSPNEGIVIGSVQIKGGQDLIGRTKWEIVAEEIRVTSPPSLLSSAFPPLVPPNFAFAIQAHRDGDEEFFFKKMPAGNYRFWQLYQPGFSTATASINIKFRVEPGKTTYIGRLFIEFPPGLHESFTKFEIRIQDRKESTLDVARKRVGFAASDVVTDLMTSPFRACLSGHVGAGSQRVEIPC